MDKSPMFETIRKFYRLGLYTNEQVYNFVEKGKLTEEAYLEIVNED